MAKARMVLIAFVLTVPASHSWSHLIPATMTWKTLVRRPHVPYTKHLGTFAAIGCRDFHSSASHATGDEQVKSREIKERFDEREEMPPGIGIFKLFHNDLYQVALPATHRFPMGKYRIVRERIQHHAQAAANIDLEASPLARSADLRTTHCPEYIKRFLCNMLTERENRNIGFPWSPPGVKRALSSVGGTVAAAHAVCVGPHLFSGHVAGGTHHAFYDYGEGFCVFSDIAVAANVVLRDYPHIQRILIIDLDVHQGNGNAVLFAQDPRVTTFSMHCAGNFFSARQHSDVDVELPVACSDEHFLHELQIWLPRVMAQARPQLIFYQAGVDTLENDKLGKCALTLEGLRQRNLKIYEAALGANCRLVVTMGGGYPKDTSETSQDFARVVAAHTDVYLQAAQAVRTFTQLRV